MSILKRENAQTIANILKGKQTLLVMKQAPKNSEGCWWYLYCSKGKPYLLNKLTRDICFWEEKQITADDMLNDKVIARFWCDKVVERPAEELDPYRIENEGDCEIEGTCLSSNQICDYVGHGFGEDGIMVYYIHISKLEIFDRPRYIGEFKKPHTIMDILNVSCKKADEGNCNLGKSLKTGKWIGCNKFTLTKAPINYCYVEGE